MVLPDVVPANRTEKIPLSGTTLDDILTAVGETRASLQVEITVVDHYDRRSRSGWVDVDRAVSAQGNLSLTSHPSDTTPAEPPGGRKQT